MNRIASVSFLAAVGAASFLLSGVAQASVINVTASKYTGTTLDLSNDVGPGMTTNIDWVHFLTGNLSFHGTSTTSGTVSADLAKNVTPLIGRTMTFTAKPGATSSDWVQASSSNPNIAGTPSYVYSDAVSGSGSTSLEGLFSLGDINLSITVPDTNPYVLSFYAHEKWGNVGIRSVSLSDGTTGNATWKTDGLRSLFRFDIAFQASQPNETLTVMAGFQNYSQGMSSPGATLSTVPEPAAFGLLAVGALGTLRRRRRA